MSQDSFPELRELLGRELGEKPSLFDLSRGEDLAQLKDLIASGVVRFATDDYEEEIRELYGIEHPADVYKPGFKEAFQAHYAQLQEKTPLWRQGRWVFFPWRAQIAHILPEDEYFRVRTARNQNLITTEEQEKYYNATVGIAGLSVGSSVTFAIVLQGGAKHLKLADMDRLALSNTNRVLAGADRLGELKVVMAARMVYELNPYAQIELFPEGLKPHNLDAFFDGLDVVIDEIDELSVKCLIREEAKKRRLPVVMAADNGDNAVVDIDRYDLDPALPYFHDRMGEVSYDSLSKLDKFGTGKMITKLVGPENVTERMQASLLEMGKSIVSWPQLGGAALINGAAVAYCVRKILTGEPLEDNRALISLDEKLIPGYLSPEAHQRRAEISHDFAKRFDLA